MHMHELNISIVLEFSENKHRMQKIKYMWSVNGVYDVWMYGVWLELKRLTKTVFGCDCDELCVCWYVCTMCSTLCAVCAGYYTNTFV